MRYRSNPKFVGVLTFHDSEGTLLGTETCTGARDAKEHAGHLAVEYGGDISIRRAGREIGLVGEEYLDHLCGW